MPETQKIGKGAFEIHDRSPRTIKSVPGADVPPLPLGEEPGVRVRVQHSDRVVFSSSGNLRNLKL